MNKHPPSRDDLVNDFIAYGDAASLSSPFSPGLSPIPASGKVLSGSDYAMMAEAVLDGWLTAGRFNALFETELSSFLGVNHAVTTNSGSSANLLALSTLTSPKLLERQLKPGDEVITVAAGFPTTVNPIIQNNLVPVFVDVELPTYNIQAEHLEDALSPKTRAVMLAHTLGNPFNIDLVSAFCKKHNLWLIEDCCDALGSEYNGEMVGTFGDIGTLSFYPAHHITMGEGGAVFTNSSELRVLIESYRDWGRDCYCEPGKDNTCGRRFHWQLGDLPEGYDHKYTYSHLGYNLKITDIQAACGLSQLRRIDQFIEKRRRNFTYLSEQLETLAEFLLLPKPTNNSNPSWFGFPITLKSSAGTSRRDFLEYLDQNQIGTRLVFAGNITKQPYFKNIEYRIAGSLENTDIVMNQTFWIGVYPGLTIEMLDYVVETMESYFGIGF